MRELSVVVGMDPWEAFRRLQVAAEAEGILLRGSAAGFRLVVCEGNRCIGPRVAVIRPRAGR